jgi:hypothetical protein
VNRCWREGFRTQCARDGVLFQNRRCKEVKESPGRAQGSGYEGSRRTVFLDAPILSQSRKAQNCYLAMAAMRPGPSRAPRAGTSHLPRVVGRRR